MIPAEFDYLRPLSVQNAVTWLAEAGEEAKVLAGGQSLLPLLRLRLAYPEVLIDLDRVEELREITEDDSSITIGAMATHHAVVHSDLVREHAPLVAKAAATVADPAVRHRGTFGGSLAHADPAGDLPAVVLALDGTFLTASPRGVREIPAAGFFVDYLTTALEGDELLTGVRIPKLGSGWKAHYEKFHRTAQAWAIVGVACAVRREQGIIEDSRIALTNMGPTPVRAHSVERALSGSTATASSFRSAASRLDNVDPPSDLHGSSEYRRHLVQVLTARALGRAAV
jgi:carbon-monoxide dehydrogenase medium subunit